MRDYSEWYTMIKKATFDELLDKEKVVNIQTRNYKY